MNRKKILSLNGLKALGYLCVFTEHCHLMLRNKFSVTLFFMVSGFLLFLTKNDTFNKCNISSSTKFALNQLKFSVWVIHIIFFILSIVVRYDEIITYGKNIFIFGLEHILLLQSLFLQPFKFNYASWFLSCLFILYFFAPLCILWIKKSKNELKIFTVFIILYCILDYYTVKFSPKLDFFYWNPFYRLPDFIIGMIVCKLYVEPPLKVSKLKMDVLNSIVVIGFAILLLIQFTIVETNNYFVLFFSFMIYVLAHDTGWFCECLKSNKLQFLTSIGLEFYLSHELIVFIIERYLYAQNFSFILNINIMIWVISFPLSVILAFVLHSIVGKIKKSYKGMIW